MTPSCVERSRPRDHRHPASRTPFSRRNLIPVHRSVTTTLQHQQIIYIHHEDCYCSIRHPFGHCLGFRPYATNCWCVKCSGNDHSDGNRTASGRKERVDPCPLLPGQSRNQSCSLHLRIESPENMTPLSILFLWLLGCFDLRSVLTFRTISHGFIFFSFV